MSRYVYHYCAAAGPVTKSGIAQLAFRITSQDDLDRLRELVSEPDFGAEAITSLSYLGREENDAAPKPQGGEA